MSNASQKPLLFATPNYEYLKEKIYDETLFECGQIESKIFPDGERYQRILSDVRNRDVVLIAGTIHDQEVLTLYDLACALVKYEARKLILVIPYFGYSTMERAVKEGEVVTAKTRARLISSIPDSKEGNHVIMLDLHSEGIPFYFEGNITTKHLYGKEVIIQAAQELANTFHYSDFILASTDAGRAKWVESLAHDLHVSPAFVFKKRLSGSATKVTGINADVLGKFVIIYDDMIRSGSSLIQAAKAYKEAGAKDIAVISTHGLFPKNAIENIKNSGLFKQILTTDSHPRAFDLHQKQKDSFFKTLTVANIIQKEVIKHI